VIDYCARSRVTGPGSSAGRVTEIRGDLRELGAAARASDVPADVIEALSRPDEIRVPAVVRSSGPAHDGPRQVAG